MSDIEENQELNMEEINFDDFENFDASEEMQTVENGEAGFDTSEFDNFTFDEQSTDEMTGEMSAEFSFDEITDSDMSTMYESSDDRQEPYLETVMEDVSSFEENITDATEVQSYEEAPVMEEYVEEAVTEEEAPVVEEYVEDVTAEEAPVMEEYVEEAVTAEEAPAMEEYVEEAVTEEEVPVMEEYVEDTVSVEDSNISGYEASSSETLANAYFENDVDVITEDVGAYSVVPPQNLKYIQWYSGNSQDEMFEFGKSSGSVDFTGTKDCNTVHVNVGYDTYGWNVQFSDGIMMSLRDVREYQIRNGKLPNSSGRIVYGQNVLSFDKVDRIVVYEAVKYFSYGV